MGFVELKELQTTYNTLVVEVQALLDTHIQRVQPPAPKSSPPTAVPRTTSSTFFAQLKPKPKTRARSNTNPTAGSSTTTPIPEAAVDSGSLDLAITSSQAVYKSLVEAFWNITSKYRISWECAELLIELGSGGDGGVMMSAPPSAAMTTTSVSAPAIQQHLTGAGGESKASLRGRDRAITLVDDEPKHLTTPTPQNDAQTQVQSQPSSAVVSMTGSSSMPGGVPSANDASSGPPLASPPNMSWRASTGRHDLSQRQLVLLREILNNNNGSSIIAAYGDEEGGLRRPPPHFSIPLAEDSTSAFYPSARSQFVNRDWRWGDAMNSTITLSEEQESDFVDGGDGRRDRKLEKEKKRRSGRVGMSGIRDILRSLKKSHVEEPRIGNSNLQQQQHYYHHHYHHGRLPPAVPVVHSTTSLSTQSSIGSKSVHHQPQPQQQQNHLPIPRIPSQIKRRGRSSTGPESMRSNKGPSPTSFTPSSFTAPKPSPRRPSLASIFRIGSNKTRPVSGVVYTGVGISVEDPTASSSSAFAASKHDLSAAQSSSVATGTGGEDSNNSTGEEEEEDWDRMDSASDLDAAAAVAAAKALGGVDGPYDVSATVRGRNKLKIKADERKNAGGYPYLQHQSSYESDHHHPPPPLPSLPASSSSTGLGGFLARHSIIPKRSFSASQSSIWGSGGCDGQQQHSPTVPSRLSRHSNFEEPQQPTNTANNVEPASLRISSSKSAPTRLLNFVSSGTPGTSSSRPSSSRSTKFPNVNVKTGSVRSMPPHLVGSSPLFPSGVQSQPSPLPDPKLAMIMTPENIKPLLENAKEVHVKLHECIAEIRALIEGAVGQTGGAQMTATQASMIC